MTWSRRNSFIDLGGHHLRAAMREFLFEEGPAAAALDDQDSAAGQMFQSWMPQQALRVECSAWLHRHPVTGLIEGSGGRGTQRGKCKIAPLIEQRRTEPHRV